MEIKELLKKARLLAEQGFYDEAADLIGKVLTLESENIHAMFISAFILIKTEKLESAVQVYKRIIELNPDNAVAMFLLGLVYEQMNDLSSAKTWWSLAISCKCDEDIRELAISKLESCCDE